MPDPCCCCETSSPEPVSTVNVTSTEVTADAALSTTLGTVSSPTDPLTIALQIVDEDGAAAALQATIDWWLVDTNNAAADKSVQVPNPLPGANEGKFVMDAAGAYSFVIQNTGALKTWYAVFEYLNLTYVVGPISLGA